MARRPLSARITYQTINTRSLTSMRGTKNEVDARIGTTVMPYGLDHSEKPGMSREPPRTRRLRQRMNNPSALVGALPPACPGPS